MQEHDMALVLTVVVGLGSWKREGPWRIRIWASINIRRDIKNNNHGQHDMIFLSDQINAGSM